MVMFVAETSMILQTLHPMITAMEADRNQEILSRLQALQSQVSKGVRTFNETKSELSGMQRKLDDLAGKLPAKVSIPPPQTVCLLYIWRATAIKETDADSYTGLRLIRLEILVQP